MEQAYQLKKCAIDLFLEVKTTSTIKGFLIDMQKVVFHYHQWIFSYSE